MNEKKYPIGELAQSASPSSQATGELAERKRNQKKSLVKVSAMLILSIIMLIISTIDSHTF